MKNTKFTPKNALNLLGKLKDEELMHYAASLSFHTIIAVIPVLLISFAIFTRMPIFSEYYGRVKEFVFSALLPTHQEMLVAHLENFLQASSTLGYFGVVAIIFTSIMFFDDYEHVVNAIMQTKRRKFLASLSSFLALVVFAPFGLAISFFLSNFAQNLLDASVLTSWINLLLFLPYFIVWMIFYTTYIASVSVSIKFKNVAISSLISSLVWSLSKSAFVYYAVHNKTYTNIYGSFAVVLFFFLWVYISWIIFLYGLKICKFLEFKTENR